MIAIALLILGFLLAYNVSLRATLGVGALMFGGLVVFFTIFSHRNVPDVTDSPSLFVTAVSHGTTGVASFFVVGVAVVTIVYSLGAYSVGAIAGRLALRYKEQEA